MVQVGAAKTQHLQVLERDPVRPRVPRGVTTDVITGEFMRRVFQDIVVVIVGFNILIVLTDTAV